MNIFDIVIIILLIAIVIFAIAHIRKGNANGCSSCSEAGFCSKTSCEKRSKQH